jgi:signal peptidase I
MNNLANPISLFADLLTREANLRVKVTGKSMAPFIRSHEIVTIKRAHPASLYIGDIVFFTNNLGMPTLHRLIKKHAAQEQIVFQTKGDALCSCDPPISEQHILGKVCHIEKILPFTYSKYTIDMESSFWKRLNYVIARLHVMRSTLDAAIMEMRKHLKPAHVN